MDTSLRHFRLVILSVMILATVTSVCGCRSAPRAERRVSPPVPEVIRVTQHVGGTHYRVLKHEDVLYQAFGPELLVLDSRSNRLLRSVELGAIGESGSAVDLLIHDNLLYVVLDRESVVELSISDPRSPLPLGREHADSLGIWPRRLSVVDDELFVSGIGGIVRWSDGHISIREEGEFSRVARSGLGLVACVGRRIFALDDGRFVGSATELVSAADLDRAPDGSLVFVRQSPNGALVGLMTSELREVDVDRTTVAVPGRVHSIRIFNNLIWVVADKEILALRLVHDDSDEHRRLRLISAADIDVIGARDLAKIDESHIAIAGSFGRAIYRQRATSRGPRDTFTYAHREPSQLTKARTDGRHILAGGPEGAWLYHIGSRVQPSDMPLDDVPPPLVTAETIDAAARISDDGQTLFIEYGAKQFGHTETRVGGGVSTLHTVVAVEGEFWIGHDDGILVATIRPASGRLEPELEIVHRLRMDGPVRYLFPLRTDRGVSFVSTYGGFGLARYAPVNAADGL